MIVCGSHNALDIYDALLRISEPTRGLDDFAESMGNVLPQVHDNLVEYGFMDDEEAKYAQLVNGLKARYHVSALTMQ
jgi:hypothetical protein